MQTQLESSCMKDLSLLRKHTNRAIWPHLLVLSLATLIVGGCGFQLEGSRALPISIAKTYIDTSKPYTELYDSLRDALRGRGAELVQSRQEAGAVLRILEDSSGQRILSVSARNTPREYEVFYVITFSLESEGSSLIENQTLIITRSYTYDAMQVLGMSAEEQILRKSLAQDLARQVLRLIEVERSVAPMTPS